MFCSTLMCHAHALPGKHGWFGLCNPLSLPVDDNDVDMTSTTANGGNDIQLQNGEQDFTFEPKVFYSPAATLLSQQYSRKRRHSYHSSGGESVSSLSGSEDELGEMEIEENGSSEFTSDEEEESVVDNTLYRKKYRFVKRIAKNIIYVSDVQSYTHTHTHNLVLLFDFVNLVRLLIIFQENAALASRMAAIKEKIDKAQAEKK